MVGRVRERALERLRTQIALAFGDDPGSPTTDQLARFALAAFDGAFVACQTDPGVTLGRLLEPLAPSLVASHRALAREVTEAPAADHASCVTRAHTVLTRRYGAWKPLSGYCRR